MRWLGCQMEGAPPRAQVWIYPLFICLIHINVHIYGYIHIHILIHSQTRANIYLTVLYEIVFSVIFSLKYKIIHTFFPCHTIIRTYYHIILWRRNRFKCFLLPHVWWCRQTWARHWPQSRQSAPSSRARNMPTFPVLTYTALHYSRQHIIYLARQALPLPPHLLPPSSQP